MAVMAFDTPAYGQIVPRISISHLKASLHHPSTKRESNFQNFNILRIHLNSVLVHVKFYADVLKSKGH